MDYHWEGDADLVNKGFYKVCSQPLQTCEVNQRHIWTDAQKDQKWYNQFGDQENNEEDEDPRDQNQN